MDRGDYRDLHSERKQLGSGGHRVLEPRGAGVEQGFRGPHPKHRAASGTRLGFSGICNTVFNRSLLTSYHLIIIVLVTYFAVR